MMGPAQMGAPMPPDPMMGGGDPMMGGMPPMGPPDEDAMLMMLIQAVMQKWDSEEAQMMGEKDVLMQTLMMLAQPPNPGAPVEGGMPMGMM